MESIFYLYGFGFLLWLYSLISVLKNEFKNSNTKLIWIILLIFLPVSCVLYPFMKGNQIVGHSTFSKEDVLVGLLGGFAGAITSYIVPKTINFFDLELNSFVKIVVYLLTFIGVIFLSIVVFAILTVIYESIFKRNSNYKKIIKNAKEGIAEDQNRLGVMYLDGNYVEQDLNQAVYWFEKAAEQNNAWGLYNLAERYYSGDYFQQNYQKANELYLQAAQLNHSNAQNKLGIIYDNGYGVETDTIKACNWFEKAANNNFDWGQSNLAGMYRNGRGVQQDYLKAYMLYKKASEQGNEVAKTKLAEMYILGEGLTKNLKQAKKILHDLYQNNNQDAIAIWNQYKLNEV